MPNHKLVYPVALTNRAWQAQKGVLKATSTGIGETLDALERSFKRTSYDEGVDVERLVTVDPAQTYKALVDLAETYERQGRPLTQAIGVTRKKILEVERTIKGKLAYKKAQTHLQSMKEALASLEEQQGGFMSAVCGLAHERFLEEERASIPAERFTEVCEEAERLSRRFGEVRSGVRSAKTGKELVIAIGMISLNAQILDMLKLWDLATSEYDVLLAQMSSPLRNKGAAYARYEKLKIMYSLGSVTNDFNARSTISSLMKETPGTKRTELDAVKYAGGLYLEELDQAEALLRDILDVYEALDKSRVNIARLRQRED